MDITQSIQHQDFSLNIQILLEHPQQYGLDSAVGTWLYRTSMS